MERRNIKKVAVLGSGVMGSRIALHFANVGIRVLLLDIVPRNASEEELKSPKFRNSIVDGALKSTLKSKPNPIYTKKSIGLVKTGNFDDNMHEIADADLILEAVVENLDIKKIVFEQVDKYRKAGSIVASNTSGIQIESMLAERSDSFQSNFVGLHFFNPPRYLRLLEVIPSSKTNQEVVDYMMHFGDRILGKTTVLCKDTPAFIANRIGVFSIMAIFHIMEEMEMSVEEVDALTGPISGRPKSATFRTCDVVGIDTLVKVANNAYKDCVDDESRDLFKIPSYVEKMLENGWYGDKTKQGFYKKEKVEGKRVINALNLNTFEYAKAEKPKFACVAAAKPVEDLRKRIKVLHSGKDKGADFLNTLMAYLFEYVSNRVPEISDEVYRVDDAVKAGFGWELGPFETWDALGVKNAVEMMQAKGKQPAAWILEMLEKGNETFYKVENGVKMYYDQVSGSYKAKPGSGEYIILENLKGNKPVWSNSGTTLHDLGDGVLNLEFHTKMNSIGSEVLQGINESIKIAENEGWKGLVIGNDAPNFSAGANLAMIFMLALEQEYDELEMAIRMFQQSTMRIRYSSIPVVSAPHGMTLGGGCEVNLHADKVVAAAETYMGLVEVGVGLIPAGGGTKELALRASDSYDAGDPMIPTIVEKFKQIAMASVATSAGEAMEMGFLKQGRDIITINQDRVIADAKTAVLDLSKNGYIQPASREDIMVLGKTGLGALYSGADALKAGKYASDHDIKIAQKVAWVLCGGDLSTPTKVTEQYLLDLEREAFLSLLGEKKTLERIQSILQTGRPLRN